MEKIEKILELLDKQNLTQEEQNLFKQFTSSDDELNSFLTSYRKLESSLSSLRHIPADLLAEFVLYETGGDESNGIIMGILKPKVSDHLKVCSDCRKEYNELRNEYSVITDHVSKSISQKPISKQSNSFSNSFLKGTGTFKYAFAVLALIMVTYAGLFVVSSSITPDYKKNLFENDFENSYLTRGRTSPSFQQGMSAIDEKNYPKAIEFLTKDITDHKNEKSIFYSHYILGLTYLKVSESDFLGLFKSYSNENVDLAITNFELSLQKNSSGSYENLRLDTYYYLGRAYLLIDNTESAILNFQKVV